MFLVRRFAPGGARGTGRGRPVQKHGFGMEQQDSYFLLLYKLVALSSNCILLLGEHLQPCQDPARPRWEWIRPKMTVMVFMATAKHQ